MNTSKFYILVVLGALICLWPGMSATATAQIEKTIWQAELENPDQQKIIVTLKTRREKSNTPTKGLLQFWPEGKPQNTISIQLTCLKKQKNYAWLAGKCIDDKKSGQLKDHWLFIALHDGGTPGRLADHLWLEWLPQTPDAEQKARKNVEKLQKPKQNMPVTDGNIIVDDYEQVEDIERL